MDLTELGKIVEQEWINTPTIRPDMNLELGEFVVMPNHFHAILIIGENKFNSHGVFIQNAFKPQSKNLASVMRGFKSAVTTFARKNRIQFDWQTRYHDHIIRSMDEFERISNYIANNPTNWQNDMFSK